MNAPHHTGSHGAEFWVAAALLAAAAAFAFHIAPQVPYGVPYDEWVKVNAVRDGTQNFQHPILMLQVVRTMNLFAGAREPLEVVALGRLAAALSGGLLVFFTIVLARRAMGIVPALGAGLLAAVPPLTVLHAQLFKEDIFVAPWLIAGLIAIDRLRQSPSIERAVVFGVVAGLAASAKYIGVILIPLSLLAPLFMPTRARGEFYKMAGLATIVALIAFSAINFPAFLTPDIFSKGLGFEIRHAVSQHLFVHHGWHSYFVFTWTANLWPGLLAPVAIAGMAGAVLVLLHWHKAHPAMRLVLIFGVVWYLLHELSPMKPHPEGARHMVVMAAIFAILSALALDWLAEKFAPSWRMIATAGLVLLLAAVPARASLELTRSAPNDTNLVVERAIQAIGEPVMRTQHTRLRAPVPRLNLRGSIDEILGSTRFLVINEVFARDYVRSVRLGRQPRNVRHYSAVYGALLQRPAVRVTSTAGAYAYRNTPYRIVALQGDVAHLKQVADALSSVPGIAFEILPGSAGPAPE